MRALMAIAAFIGACAYLGILVVAILVAFVVALVCWVIAWLFGDREEESGGEDQERV